MRYQKGDTVSIRENVALQSTISGTATLHITLPKGIANDVENVALSYWKEVTWIFGMNASGFHNIYDGAEKISIPAMAITNKADGIISVNFTGLPLSSAIIAFGIDCTITLS